MTDYEQIIISAERYALGRMTYIVEITVNYILEEIENDKLSDTCLSIIAKDIRSTKDLGMDCVLLISLAIILRHVLLLKI